METKIITESRIKGDLIFDGNVEFKTGCYVAGKIDVTGFIEAGWSIEAGGSITAGGSIKAGGSINAGTFIKAGRSIMAGRSIEAGGYIFSFTFSVSSKKLTTSRLPFWRDFYASMPPLKKWRKQILDEGMCWDTLRELPTNAEARKICKWDGWHWLLRAQLEMFFGLTDKVVPPKEK